MQLSPAQWHERFQQQARWTVELRDHLYARLGLERAQRVIEIGCGTGAILADLAERMPVAPHGLDLQAVYLLLARRNAPQARLAQADALKLPYAAASFDLVVCHFLLLWLRDPAHALAEMARVARPGAAVAALAEPDYGGRIDYPVELAQIGLWQEAALRRQGARTRTGRGLASLFLNAGLEQVEVGLLGGRWRGPTPQDELEAEWSIVRADLQGQAPEDELERLFELDRAASQRGDRILFVPTFYAIGWTPAARSQPS